MLTLTDAEGLTLLTTTAQLLTWNENFGRLLTLNDAMLTLTDAEGLTLLTTTAPQLLT